MIKERKQNLKARPRSQRAARAIMLVLAFLLGLLLALQVKSLKLYDPRRASIDKMESALLEQMQKNELLRQRNQDLSVRLLQIEQGQASQEARLEQILKELDALERFAGLSDVQNSGLLIFLEPTGGHAISDDSLLDYLNELRAAGAQALAVNDERCVAMTEIRETNQDIIINGKPFDRKQVFVIKAITAPSKSSYLLSLLKGMAPQIIRRENQQLEISVKEEEQVLIKALAADSLAGRSDLLKPAGK